MNADRTLSVLLCDPDPPLAREAERWLSAAGYSLTFAPSGRPMIRGIEDGTFDVVVVEVRLPDQHGIEVIGGLRAKCPTTRIIATAGEGQYIQSLKEAAAAGAHSILKKPYSREELLGALELAMTRPLNCATPQRPAPDDSLPVQRYPSARPPARVTPDWIRAMGRIAGGRCGRVIGYLAKVIG